MTFKDMLNENIDYKSFDKKEYDNYLKLSSAVEEFNKFYDDNKKYLKNTFPGYDAKNNIQYTTKDAIKGIRKELIRFTSNAAIKSKRYELGGNQ